MGIKLANNAFGTLAAGIASGATSITLTTGHGARFPFLSAGDYFYATLIDTSNNLEIVKCTAMQNDVLTVTRAQEGTTARAYSAGDRIEIRLTAQTFSDVVDVTALAKKDGSNATGTWPVSVSGNAATAMNAEKLGGESYTAYVRSVSGKTPGANGDVAVPSLGAALYTSSGSWTVPAGVTTAEVEVVSGGGGGGANYAGGHGASCRAVVSGLTPGASITITVGAGGAGDIAALNTSSGGASSFGSYVTCTGGGGGKNAAGADGSYSTSATVIGGRTDFVWTKRSGSMAAQTFSLTSGSPAGSGGGYGTGGVSGKVLVKW